MNETDPTPSLWPTYALRAWLSAVHSQTQQARSQIEAYVNYHENEINRLRGQTERAGKVLESLEDSIKLVDDALRRVRDAEVKDADTRAEARGRGASTAEASSTGAADESTSARKSSTGAGQRKGRTRPSRSEREPPGQSETPEEEEGSQA